MPDTTGTDLEAALSEARERAETALDATTDGTLPDEEADAVRAQVERVADATADATFDELLRAAGFENLPEDVSPTDVPNLVQEASSETVIELRRLLEMADLGETWTDLDEEERLARLERIVRSDGADAGEDDDDSRSVGELLSTVWSTAESEDDGEVDESGGETEESTVDGTDESETTADESGTDLIEALGDGDSFDEEMARLRSRLEAIVENAGDAEETDEEADEEVEEEAERDESGRSSSGDSRSRLSLVPSSRSDMGRSTRLSTTWRGK